MRHAALQSRLFSTARPVLASPSMIRNEQPGLAPDRRSAALLRSLLLLAA
jgi:hypothetical protein